MHVHVPDGENQLCCPYSWLAQVLVMCNYMDTVECRYTIIAGDLFEKQFVLILEHWMDYITATLAHWVWLMDVCSSATRLCGTNWNAGSM